MVALHERSRQKFSCCFAYRVVSGSFAASFSTYSSTTGSSSARGTARLTSPPPARPARGDGPAERVALPRPPPPAHARPPRGGAAGRPGAVLDPDVPDAGVVGHHGQVAPHLPLVAAADTDAVD